MSEFLGFVAFAGWLFMGGRSFYMLMNDFDKKEGVGAIFLFCVVLAPFAYGFATILPKPILSKAKPSQGDEK